MKNRMIGALAAFGTISSISAAVTAVGVDTTTAANWRTAAALEADNEYGTDGFRLFGFTSPDGIYVGSYTSPETNATTVGTLPGGMTLASTYAGGMWPGNGANNFGQMQDPTNGNALVSAGLLANGGATTWTLTRPVEASLRLTLLLASGDNEGTTHQATVNDGSGAISSTSTAHASNGLHYHVFDISMGTTDITFSNTPNSRQLTGIAVDAFTPIPEPTTTALLGLGGVALILRRRK